MLAVSGRHDVEGKESMLARRKEIPLVDPEAVSLKAGLSK
jgi:hypothetical protein